MCRPNITDLLQREHPKFLPEQEWGMKNWLWAYKTGNISETVEDRAKLLLTTYIKSTGWYIGLYPPRIRLSKLLRSNNDVWTVIEHISEWVLNCPKNFILPQNSLNGIWSICEAFVLWEFKYNAGGLFVAYNSYHHWTICIMLREWQYRNYAEVYWLKVK